MFTKWANKAAHPYSVISGSYRSLVTRKPVFGVSESHKMVRGSKFRIYEEEGLYYPCSENKGADQLRGFAKLICVFVFAYAKSRFSYDEAHSTQPT